MKSISTALCCSALLAVADAHWIFDRIVYENKWTQPYEYVREVSPANVNNDLALIYPNTDPDSVDLRCGRNATLGWSQPKTAPLNAGDSLGFIVNLASVAHGRMYHPGFASAWLSKAPSDDLNSYLGDGDWFKIMSVTGRTAQSFNTSNPALKYDDSKVMWGAYNSDSWNFTIPATTPPGKYLVRFEYIFPNVDDAQFYLGCAHIDVKNSGTVGTPGPLVKIPGVYKRGQPDVYFSSYDYYLSSKHIEDFVAPYPPVWQG
ncbi:lytic polysaccharide monooxygenase [Lophiostoma macrostomum CBS 122681]|uniref:AA9 family lytic polysaccharide monooxygenase n=1 Tax=Lophiostoma macrostomum CBS 122681 TaxID=1314788 RepID=A0A6A6TS30_9PLEO|nr:lytic polysaccharide monooxygenase [Lophiostoma macrostomum CBS 122681]